jgi:hypothetical protein
MSQRSLWDFVEEQRQDTEQGDKTFCLTAGQANATMLGGRSAIVCQFPTPNSQTGE